MEKSKSIGALIWSICLLLASAGLFFMASPAWSTSTEASVIKLKYGSYTPSQGLIDDPVLWYIDEVSKRSGIKIKLETYYGGTLAKPPDCLNALGKGVYQLGWISSAFTPGQTPLSVIPGATPLVAKTMHNALKSADELVRTFPPAAAEFKRANVKFLFHTGVWKYILISKKPVRSLEDIKKLRVRCYGYLSRAWAALGGVPVSIPITEAYDALQKGVIDGVLTQPWIMHRGLRLSEVAKHVTKIDMGSLSAPVIMNMDTWNKLPDKVRNEMLDLAGDMPAIASKNSDNGELKAIEDMSKEGIRMYDLPAADKARLREVAKLIAKTVVDDLTSKGVTNAKEAMDIYLKALEKNAK